MMRRPNRPSATIDPPSRGTSAMKQRIVVSGLVLATTIACVAALTLGAMQLTRDMGTPVFVVACLLSLAVAQRIIKHVQKVLGRWIEACLDQGEAA